MKFQVQGIEVELLPGAALFLSGTSQLVVADVHLGKAAGLQAHGINVPEGDNQKDLDRLSALISHTSAKQLIIAGDFFHTPAGVSSALIELVNGWTERLFADVLLVVGNHDRRALAGKGDLLMQQASIYQGEGLTIVHDPADSTRNGLTIAGHIHPAVKVHRPRLRLPCFHLAGACMTLPSFGRLTGCQVIRPKNHDRIFVESGGKIKELPPNLYQRVRSRRL